MPTPDYEEVGTYHEAKRRGSRIAPMAPYGAARRKQGRGYGMVGEEEEEGLAVTDTTPIEQKERSIRKKQQLVEALQELFGGGKLPTNEQFLAILSRLQESRTINAARGQLSRDGIKVYADFDALVETLKRVVEEKNGNEVIQSFLFHSRLAAQASAADLAPAAQGVLGAEGATSGQATGTATNKLASLLQLLVTNPSFSDLLGDLRELLEESLTGFAEQEVGLLRKRKTTATAQEEQPEQQTEQQLQPEQQSPERFDQYGEPVGYPRRAASIAASQRSRILTATSAIAAGGSPSSPVGAFPTSPVMQPQQQPETLKTTRQQPELPPTPEEPVQWSSSSAQHAKVAQTIFMDQLTPERRQAIGAQLKRLFLDIQQQPEFKDALDTIINYLREFAETSTYVADRVRGQRVSPRIDANIRMAREEFKQILENFANGKSLDPVIDSLYNFTQHIKGDFTLRNYLHELRVFVNRSLEDRNFVQDVDFEERVAEFIRRGRDLLGKNYGDDTNVLLASLNDFSNGLSEDKLTAQLASDVRNLNNDLFYNQEGQFMLKSTLVADVVNVVIPAISKQFKYIPIPRIEHSDPQYYFIMENVIFSTNNLIPNLMEISLKNRALIGLRRNIGSFIKTTMTVNLYQMHALVQDVPFYFKKRTGFPRIKEYGVADMTIGGQGITALVKLEVDRTSKTRTLTAKKVEVWVDQIHLDIHGSTRDYLYHAMAPVINAAVKKQIQVTLEDQIRSQIQGMDAQVTRIKNMYTQQTGKPVVKSGWDRVLKTVGISKQKAQRQPSQAVKQGIQQVTQKTRETITEGAAGPSTSATVPPAKQKQAHAWESDKFDLRMREVAA